MAGIKRSNGAYDYTERPVKVHRSYAHDRISNLSDELLLRILSFGSVPTLLTCQRVSKRFSRIAVDSELWKAAYYNQFVLPKASRIPGIKDRPASEHLRYSSKLSKWLDDGSLVKNGLKTNWKQQYRLRHNWSLGQCAVSEIVVAERPPEPPLLVMMQNGMIFTVDSISGLRVWNAKNEHNLIASATFRATDLETPRLPTSMAIDSQDESIGTQRVVVGFDNGSFTIFEMDREKRSITLLFSHPASSNGSLSALAYSPPFLLTMAEDQLLSLYTFEEELSKSILAPPRLLYSLRSHTVWPPVSLSIRTNATSMTAAIAYALPTYLSGWTVGIQEMRLSYNGKLIESRLATAAEHNYQSLAGNHSMSSPSSRASSPFPVGIREPVLSNNPSRSKPTTLSYSHPYLLVAHPDNTLTLYLIKSTSSVLSIGPGVRLWGHTSSVSGAHVGVRGKAVSVSRLGDELRVWDLEGGMASVAARKHSQNGEISVRIQPSKMPEEFRADLPDPGSQRNFGLRLALEQGFDDLAVSQGWVGFDERNVIVLREKSHGSQALVVYDFS
ncbi:F-box domain-containing protein [Lojkania enalia]|uniref:F-box domain-containing protein n=1 Tax=Lojkania enalia TaxID=147567 RepID=A0A9P4KAU4_9PLEO|nr:F-box domain-containing protein [Didymosphaeria enalia]